MYLAAVVGLLWIVRWGGAERLCRSEWARWLFIGFVDTPESLKLGTWILFVIQTIWFVAGWVNPDLRPHRRRWWRPL
jgi:hypothetical protein